MKYKIEFDLPDNETIVKEIKTAPVQWAIWGYSGYAFATEVKTLTMEDVKKINPPRIPTATEPRRIDGKHNHFIKCGNCNYDLLTGYLFCPHCGKAVKLE